MNKLRKLKCIKEYFSYTYKIKYHLNSEYYMNLANYIDTNNGELTYYIRNGNSGLYFTEENFLKHFEVIPIRQLKLRRILK